MRRVALLLLFACGCLHASTQTQTQVRRVDSLAGVDEVGDALGQEGWTIVDVEPLGNGWAYVVVLQRRAVQ